jgi:hypothetical protein
MNALLVIVTVLAVPLALGAAVLALSGLELDSKTPIWLAFAAPLGLGIAGLADFISLVVADRILVGLELAVLAVLLLFVRRLRHLRGYRSMQWSLLPALLAAALAVSSAVAALAFVGWTFNNPSGDWDAWAFWNTKARVLAAGGETWTWIFSQLIHWWHPEYPALQPAMIARGWVLVGSETPLVPAIVAAAFALGTVTLLVFALGRLRDRATALLGGLILVGSPTWILHGASQYADIPLGFFMLLAVVAIASADAEPARGAKLVALAGLAAGLAAFTKNEGMLFCACLVLARSLTVLQRVGRAAWWREARAFAKGAAVPLLLVALHEVDYASRPANSEFLPTNHGLSNLAIHVGHQLSDPIRWHGFFEAWWMHLSSFDGAFVPVLALLFGYAAVAGLDPERRRATTRTVALLVGLDLIGTSAVFLGWSTLEIHEHMDALHRLLLQLLPTLTLSVLLAVRGPLSRVRSLELNQNSV